MILAWYQIGHKITLFYFYHCFDELAFFIHFVPGSDIDDQSHYQCPVWGAVMGTGIGFALKSSISSGGTDIVS